MTIERTNKEVIIRIPNDVDTSYLENLVDYIRYRELTSESNVSQDEVNSLVNEIKKGRWTKNKERLIGSENNS